ECLGGGTCTSSFGTPSANPCRTSTCFATTGASTYWVFRDASAQSSDISIDNCSIWVYQADPYQRCTGTGGNNGDPCRQECDNSSTTPGLRCEVNADCGAGTCLRTGDCHLAGGTGSCSGVPCCAGSPHSPAGPGLIEVLDLSRTLNARIVNVSVYDHFLGDYTINTGPRATIRDSNFAREITDCTTPLTGTPTNTTCFTTNTGKCCYGAATQVGNGNVQPTTNVVNAVTTSTDSQLLRVTARGATASFFGGARNRIDESSVWPDGPLTAFDFAGGWGPGTPANGYTVGQDSIVAKSYGLNLVGSGVGIALAGTEAGAVANKFWFNTGASGGTCINASNPNAHIVSNICTNLTGAGKGVSLSSSTATVEGMQINNAGGTTTGISITGGSNLVKTTQIALVGSNQNGITSSGSFNEISGAIITGVNGGKGIAITGGNNLVKENVVTS